MRYRSNGGVIGPVVSTNTTVAAGVWAMPDFQQKLSNSTWPIDQTQSLLSEPYFEYNTLLMKAVGANTTQNYTFVDSSTTATSITRNGDVTQGAFSPYSYVDGRWATYFDGTGDYLTAGSSVSLSGDFTVECWVYGVNFGTNGFYLYGLGNDLNNTAATFFIASTGYLRVYTNNSHILSGTSATLTLNQWNHVAFVRSSNVLRAYLNGVLVDTSSTWSNALSGLSHINAELNGVGPTTYVGEACYISNLRVTTNAVYTSAFTPPSTPLTAISGTSLLVCQSNRFKDNSPNAYSITRNGDTKISPFGPFNPDSAYSASTTGGSMFFDGTGDFLTASYSTTNFDWWTNDFTLEAWIFPTTLTGWSYNDGTRDISTLIGNNDNATQTNYWSFGPITGGTVRFYYYNGAGQAVTSSTTVLVGQWNHIAMTKSASGITIYVNGTASTTTAVSGTPQSSALTPLTIGRGNATAINGHVTDIRILKGTALYSSTFTPPTTPLTAISNAKLLLNGTNAGIIDASRKVQLYTAGDAKVSTNIFKYDTSVYFDGTGDYILVPSTTYTDEYLFGTKDFTVETWIRFSALASNRVFIDAWVSGQSASWQMYYQSSTTKLIWYVGASAVLSSTTTPVVDTWYHVAVARSGTTIRLFVNGTLEANTTNHTTNYNYKAPIALGAQYSTLTNYINGYMEDTRITRGYARYTANFTPPLSKLTTL